MSRGYFQALEPVLTRQYGLAHTGLEVAEELRDDKGHNRQSVSRLQQL